MPILRLSETARFIKLIVGTVGNIGFVHFKGFIENIKVAENTTKNIETQKPDIF